MDAPATPQGSQIPLQQTKYGLLFHKTYFCDANNNLEQKLTVHLKHQ
jgi:hypothetical protein